MSSFAVRSQSIAHARPAATRYLLGGLLAFGALNAFAGGYYGMSGAEDVPKEWLEGTPFSDYFIPGLILFIIAGGSFLVASIMVFAKLRHARAAAFAAGAVVLRYRTRSPQGVGDTTWVFRVAQS